MLRKTVRKYVRLEEKEDSPVGFFCPVIYRGKLTTEETNGVRIYFESEPVKEQLGDDAYFCSVRRHRHNSRTSQVRDALVVEFAYEDRGNKLQALSRAVKTLDMEMKNLG